MLVEEEKELQQEETKIQSAEDYVKLVEDMRKNYVRKELYEKSEADKAVMAKALAGEGPVPESVSKQEKKPSVEELRTKFLNAGELNLSNAEYIKTALELRKAIIDEGGLDPFLPSGAKTAPTVDDITGAERAAAAFQSWLDAATDENGKIDNELFLAFQKKGIAEESPLVAARIKANSKARK